MNSQHNISVDDWFAYLDGSANPADRRRTAAAIAVDPAAAAVYQALAASDDALRREALELHRKFRLPPDSVDAACRSVLRRVRQPVFSRALLDRCEEILEPWCGRRVAASLILAAVARTRAESPDALWPAFLANAEVLASLLCGVSAAKLFVELSGPLV